MPVVSTKGNRPGSRRVALLVETSNAYSRELLHGIWDWCRRHADWTLHLTEQGRGNEPPPWLPAWDGDGIVARVETSAIKDAVIFTGLPVVNVSAAGFAPELPTVVSDSMGLVSTGASHLIERGLRNLAFCGEGRLPWSAVHERNFVGFVRELGIVPHVFPSMPEDFADWSRERRKLADWLKCLPKPVGIMACYDIRGQQVLDVCRELRLEVPAEVSVIGQHNDELLCELCSPPLSSVIPDARRSGYEAAAMLDRLMRGRKLGSLKIEVPPLGVATRQSTDVVAIPDRQIAGAVRFIREHCCNGIGVSDVQRQAGLSRTLLERRFKEHLGHPPYEEILRAKVARACWLLVSSEMTVSEVAERTGFSSQAYFSATIRQRTGRSPKQHRRAGRPGVKTATRA